MSEKEFIELINAHKGTIQSVCNRFFRKYGKAFKSNDLVQEILLETWKSMRTFKKNCTFNTWLYNIARNTCIAELRKYKVLPEIEWLERCVEVFEIEDAASEMNKQLRDHERYINVINAIDEPYRPLFEMYLDGLSYAEMSMQTGITQNALRARISRIKDDLAKQFGNRPNAYR